MTSTESRPSWSDHLSPRNWPLLWKLVAVGLVPALLALWLGVLRVADQAATASDIGQRSSVLDLRDKIATTNEAIRAERNAAAVFVAGGGTGDRAALEAAFARSDSAAGAARQAVESSDIDPAILAALPDITEALTVELPGVRRDTLAVSAPVTDVLNRYTQNVIRSGDALGRALVRQVSTGDTAGLIDGLTAATAFQDALSLQDAAVDAAYVTGRMDGGVRTLINTTDVEIASAARELRLAVTPDVLDRVGDPSATPANAERQRLVDQIETTNVGEPIAAVRSNWDAVAQDTAADAAATADGITANLRDSSAAAEDRASNLAGVNSVILMLGLLLAVTIAVLMVRSLTRSLRVLRTSALDVAQRRLPQAVESMRSGAVPDVAVEPVPLHTRDEVGQVARAFDTVHGQALKLAAEQAALQSNVSSMFVNLSRRSQALVERQLQLIEQLESNEQDPDQLSNLFQLDHLATRMRRNSENLLVLAGTDLAKRNVAPVPLVDVLRAAVSEIEQYQRIVVQAPPQATVVGRATSDVIHLLAELLDNATNFSPPESQVVMSSMRAQDGSVVVEIADSGVGMADHELADANRRLATPSAVDVSASRRMGLFVVGRLGARHGITVHLGGAPMGGPGGGLTASVTLPAHLVTVSGDTTEQAPAAPAERANANGVAPQRRGMTDRPVPRATLAVPPDGHQPDRPAGVNGLPTRTPGSSLLHKPAPQPERAVDGHDAADPPAAEQHRTRVPGAGPSAPTGSTRREPADAGDEHREQAGAPEHDGDPGSDTAPTEAVPITAAERDPEQAADGRPDGTRPDGTRPDDTRPDTDAPDRAPAGSSSDGGTGEPGPSAAGHLADPQRARAAAFAPRTAAASATDVPTDEPREEPVAAGDGREAAAPSPSEPVPPQPTVNESGATRPGATRPGATRPGATRPGATRPGADGHEADRGESGATRPDADGHEADRGKPGATTPDADGHEADRGKPGTTKPDADGHEADRGKPARTPATGLTAATTEHPSADSEGRPADDRAPATAADEAVAPADDDTPETPDGRATADADSPAGRDARPRPSPRPTVPTGSNGTYRDLNVPGTPYEARLTRGQNGVPDDTSPSQPAASQPAAPQTGPHTTPLPVVAESTPAGGSATGDPDPADPLFGPVESVRPAPAGDSLFAASVPAISELDGMPRSRRPLAGVRRGPVDVTETTPIFAEIASAWFAADRPVPVDWELGERPDDDVVPAVSAPVPADRPGPLDDLDPPVPVPATDPTGQGFATVADEGWRAASGAAAERPDELTAAGLPKRRPRARLVPGSAGSAVLAAPASPARSAESVRGRLASYQQGVRQGREIRLRRDPGRSGPQPVTPADGTAASGGDGHDEENR